ncbi:MAG: hypothetical protein R2724_33150 [Bryobacterales bacterium]
MANSACPGQRRPNQPEQNYSGQIDLNITNTLLTIRGGRYYLTIRSSASRTTTYWFIMPSTGLAGVRRAATAGRLHFAHGSDHAFDKTDAQPYPGRLQQVLLRSGAAQIKTGIGTMKNVNSVNDSWYGVNGRARIYWGGLVAFH